MIDIERAKTQFLEYANQFDLEEQQLKRKLGHSFRVMDISNKIAKKLNLEEEKIQIATLIGLLHDIARFEQYTQFKTFSDLKSFDHGDYGVQILEDNNTIRKYIDTDKYDTFIKNAIKNHNKFEIDKSISRRRITVL